MRQAGDQRAENAQGQPNARVRVKAATSEDTKPLTQDELLRWWPFTRLDPKRFPRASRRGAVAPNDVGEALL